MGTQALNSVADLEQNIGGVETLFKDSANTVVENANNAFKTAGMSANEYMSTVTSFSASLLQGLGGDTEEAAKIANTAIVDMSDNANKMGTSMELIQNAYQGFAKQNYTMLDNLKLGYGGTQSEMARLINDSGVLGDTMTVTAETVNQVSFDKIIEAIHTIQTNMGITGTTAKEAAETISGSMSSAKATWDNFLNGSGDIETFVSAFETAAGNVMNAVVEMAPRLTTGIVQLINSIIPKLPELLQTLLPALIQGAISLIQGLINSLPLLLTTLAEMLPTIVTSLVEGFIQIANSLAEQMPTIIPIIVDALLQGLLALLTNAPALIDCAIQVILGLAQGLINAIPLLISYLPQIIESLVTGIISLATKLGPAALQLIIALAKGLVQAIPQLISNIPKIISAIVDGLKKGISSVTEVGKNLISGLWNGINNAKDWILDKIKGFASSVLDGIKGFFGINSPSKEFAWVGKMNVLGLEEGMEDNIPDLNKTIDRTIKYGYDTTGLDFLTNGADNISGMFATTASVNSSSSPIYVTVNADMDVDKFGKAFVRDIKTFSGGAKNSYNYGGGK